MDLKTIENDILENMTRLMRPNIKVKTNIVEENEMVYRTLTSISSNHLSMEIIWKEIAQYVITINRIIFNFIVMFYTTYSVI